MSTLSPNVYGNEGPLAIAEATADLRNSMADELSPMSVVKLRRRRGTRFVALVEASTRKGDYRESQAIIADRSWRIKPSCG